MGGPTVTTLSYVRDALALLGFAAGMGIGVFLAARKRTTAGVLTLAGFFLLSLEPVADLAIFRTGLINADNYNTWISAYSCISGSAAFLGGILLTLALFKLYRSQMGIS
jgi:hypothetical protein